MKKVFSWDLRTWCSSETREPWRVGVLITVAFQGSEMKCGNEGGDFSWHPQRKARPFTRCGESFPFRGLPGGPGFLRRLPSPK